MPIFEYECASCGHRFDALQKATDGVLRKCPSCGRARLRKCLSGPNFQLQGAGWRKGAAKAAGQQRSTPRSFGHTLDSGPAHSHDHADGGKHRAQPQHGHHHGHSHAHGHGHHHDD